MYSYFEHRVSNFLVDKEIAANGGALSESMINTAEAKVVNQGVAVRATYSFK